MNPRQKAALERQEQLAAEHEAQEKARAANNRAKHKALLPEFEPFFRDLFERGMVPGWRAITKIDGGT